VLTESIQRRDGIGGLHEIRLRHREQRHHNIFIVVELGDSERRLKSVDQYRGLLIVRWLNYFTLRDTVYLFKFSLENICKNSRDYF